MVYTLRVSSDHDFPLLIQTVLCRYVKVFDGQKIKQHVYLDCGHANTCGGCASELWGRGERRCPMCRKENGRKPVIHVAPSAGFKFA
jgi:hypothetical protein